MDREEDELVSVVRNADGTISIEGDDRKYSQRIIRILALGMRTFTLSRSHSKDYREDSDQVRATSILSGVATIESDRLGVIGQKEYVKSVPTSIRPLPSNEGAWRGVIGYLGKQWEFKGEATYFCELYVPSPVFDELVIEHHAKRLQALQLYLKTDLWGFDYDYYAPPSGSVSWHLPPGPHGSVSFPDAGRVTIEIIRWFDSTRDLDGELDDEEVSPTAEKPNLQDHYQIARDVPENSKVGVPREDALRRLTRVSWALVVAILSLATTVLIAK